MSMWARPLTAGMPVLAKRARLRLERLGSFVSASEHTMLFEALHERAVHTAGTS